MLEKLGNKKYAVPLAIGIVVSCVMSIMFFPMANMEMKELPFAVLSLDEGVETPQGTVSAGDAIVESIVSATAAGDGEDSPIAWTRVGSQEELDEALENGEFYGALVVPADFSARQAAAKQAETQELMAQAQVLMAARAQGGGAAFPGEAAASVASPAAAQGVAAEAEGVEAPALKVILDKAKSPLVAGRMGTSISSMFQQLGVEVETETIHTGATASAGDGAAAANPMAGMMSLQLSIMPLFMVSVLTALVLSRVFKKRPGAPRSERWKSVGLQAAYAVAASLVASLCVYCILLWIAGIEAPMMDFVLFLWLASFCVMLLFIGAFNVSTALGGLVVIAGFAFGMMTGTLPFEALPAFWQDWVCPWAPQRFIGEGVRAVLFLEEGAWNAGSLPLLVIGAVGAVLACIAALVPGGKAAKEGAAA